MSNIREYRLIGFYTLLFQRFKLFFHNKQKLHVPDLFLCSRSKKQHKLHKSKSSYSAFSVHSFKWHLRLNNSSVLKVDHRQLRISCFRMHAFDLSPNRRNIGLKWSTCLFHLFSSFKFIFKNHFHNYCFI